MVAKWSTIRNGPMLPEHVVQSAHAPIEAYYRHGPSLAALTDCRLRLLNVYTRDLYNAATSRTLVNPAVISIFIKNSKFVFLLILC